MAVAKQVAVLIDRKETLRRVPLSYTKIWTMMQAGEFPRSRMLGGKAMWLEFRGRAVDYPAATTTAEG